MRADVPMTLVRPLVTSKSHLGPSVLIPGPSVVRFVAADYVPNRSRARVALRAVASSGLRPSRAVSNRLRPDQPFR